MVPPGVTLTLVSEAVGQSPMMAARNSMLTVAWSMQVLLACQLPTTSPPQAAPVQVMLPPLLLVPPHAAAVAARRVERRARFEIERGRLCIGCPLLFLSNDVRENGGPSRGIRHGVAEVHEVK